MAAPNKRRATPVTLLADTEREPDRQRTAFLEALDGEAHQRLELFIVEFVTPAFWAQIALQGALLKLLCDNERVLFFANQGLYQFFDAGQHRSNAFDLVRDFGLSPLPTVTNGQMIDCLVTLENGMYRQFWSQADGLASAANVDHRR